MKIIITGGTIDSFYDTNSCTAVTHETSVIPEYLEKTVCMNVASLEFDQVCMKDSRQIEDCDRANVVRLIEKSSDHEFVITHGTYTIFETAKYIQTFLQRKDVRVTLTGSLIPLTGFAPTDAGFNLAGAIVNSRYNKNGIYVFIKGEIYKPDDVIMLHS